MIEKDFSAIIQLIKQSRNNAIRSVNAELINLYWNVGATIHARLANANWGEKAIDELAAYIQKNNPELKGFDKRSLYRMRKFYEIYSSTEIVASLKPQLQIIDNEENIIVGSLTPQLEIADIKKTILTQLSWTHHQAIFSRCRINEEREFYIQLCIKENYSVRELERQINSSAFERTIANNKTKAVLSNENPLSVFKDTYIFEFLNLPEFHSEGDLQKGLISQMKNFILELGKDFLFIGEEFKIQVGNSDFYIDLVFYHRGLQCLVAFELKADKFKPEHMGQINFYLEALDRNVKKENENPSIGILLCKDKDNEVVEYAMSRSLSPTMVTEYKMQLPDKKLLQQKWHELFEENK